ncbi:YfiR family protein [Gammaproteobacteria bacterium]|nr:YfiR family protein [Gammaproteobacteria bacterium]
MSDPNQRLVPVVLLCLGIAWGFPHSANGASSAVELERKAVTLPLFARLSEWPADAFSNSGDEFIIGVVGDDPILPYIEKLAGESISGRTAKIVRYGSTGEFTKAHLLYVGNSEGQRLRPILAELRGRPVMTVGDMEGFAEAGGMFEFTLRDGKVRFKLNQDAVQAANIRVGVKLVKLGKIVHTKAVPDLVAEPFRLVMLPARVPFPTRATGIARGLLRPFTDDKRFTVTHVAGAKEAKQIGSKTLAIPSSVRKKLWRSASKVAYAGPNLEGVNEAVKELNTDVVLMYEQVKSFQSPSTSSVRMYLIDIKTSRIFQVEKNLMWVETGGGSDEVEYPANKLVDLYFEGLGAQPVRLAILPARVIKFGNSRVAGQSIYQSLHANEEIEVVYVAGPKLAKKLGTETLAVSQSDSRGLWKPAGKLQHAKPDLAAIQKLLDGLDIRAVLMYSFVASNDAGELQMFLVDLKTEKIYQADKSLSVFEASGDYSQQVEGFADKLVRAHLDDLADSSAEGLPVQPSQRGTNSKNLQ